MTFSRHICFWAQLFFLSSLSLYRSSHTQYMALIISLCVTPLFPILIHYLKISLEGFIKIAVVAEGYLGFGIDHELHLVHI